MHNAINRAKAAYSRMPVGIRSIAASGYGWYLRSWRYGPETERLVAEALARDAWSAEQWASYQDERLAELLHRAATRVPFYRQQWSTRRAAGDRSSFEDLSNWPILRKRDVRQDPHAFLADDVRPRQLFRLSSSGTSGTPITTWRSRRTMRAHYALFEARTRRWYGVDRSMRWAMIGGQVVTPADQVDPPFWVWNSGLKQLYLSSLHVSERNARAYLDAMHEYGVRYLLGYASSMYWLAQFSLDRSLVAPRMDVVISNAEPLLPHQRDAIGAAFGCPVRNTYGMSEIVAGATECEHGTLHVWPDAGVIEAVDDDGVHVPAGRTGALLCTGLLNDDMPLVRYEVEDRGALGVARDATCACGRRLPQLEHIEGRLSDVLFTADGRRVFWYNVQFYDLPLREGQLVQEEVDHIVVNVIPGDGFGPDTAALIRNRIQERLGTRRVDVNVVDAIPRAANGKFNAVLNRVAQRS